MISFEDLKIYYEDEDIKAFYDEYNTICNPDKLLEIAKRGILLYEPLDSMKLVHPNLVDISVLAHQNYMIANIDQYNRLKELVISGQYKDEYNNSMVFNLLIINKIFIIFFINDTEFIEYLLHNDTNCRFVNCSYVRIIHKLVEYGYIDEKLIHDYFPQDIGILNSSIFSSINDRCNNGNLFENSYTKCSELNIDLFNLDNINEADEIFSSFERENIENTQELLNLQNYFYLNKGIEEYLYNLLSNENIINNEDYSSLISLLLSNGGDINSDLINSVFMEKQYNINVLNKSERNSLLLDNINDINIIYFFQNNPHLFNKYDIHVSFNKFPIGFPIKIMKKYSNIFVNYINNNTFIYDNQYISEMINNCKNDEFIDLLNNFGFINPNIIENLPLYHRKHISNYMKTLLSFENGNNLISEKYENSYLSNLSLSEPFLSINSSIQRD